MSYLHGTDPEEQHRLSLLNDLLNRASLDRLALRGGERVLDVGSGLAQLTRAMARAAGAAGRVIGVESSLEQLDAARKRARDAGDDAPVELRRGDAADLPLAPDEWGTFDVVHARFILEHVADPLGLVRGMVRAARPGGRIVLEDDDHDLLRVWPEPPGFYETWRAYYLTFDRLGCDPYIGRKLVGMLQEAGARPSANAFNFFGGCHGDRCFEALVRNLAALVRGARPRIVAEGLAGAREVDAALGAFEAWSRVPGATLWYCTCWAEGVRPDG